ncbi:MAG: class I SAM-dependent methyltransferase [Chloroflexaceae bacterium]|nr:class I SAM-dependent methyltransferase [Chloroflexaceae bacterium]
MFAKTQQPAAGPITCPLCQHQRAHPLLCKFGHWMYQCDHCLVVFTHPMLTQDDTLDRYSTNWFEQEYLPSYGIDPRQPDLCHVAAVHGPMLRSLERFRRTNHLLDIGAGAGLFLALAQQHGWHVAGVEIAAYGPRYAAQQFGLTIHHGTIDDAHLPAEQFDVVMLQDTIEHVTNPRALLREVHRLLRPGGALIISTPNFHSLGRRLLGSRWALISPAEHVHLFCIETLDHALTSAGFAVFQLTSDANINPNLIHGGWSPISEAIKMLLQTIRQSSWARLLPRLALGDELHAVAIKRPVTTGPTRSYAR